MNTTAEIADWLKREQPAGTMSLRDLLRDFRDGDQIGWPAEFTNLRTEHARDIAWLTASIASDGQREPIVLGDDGRVWDGHHRLCVLDALHSDIDVKVTHSGGDSA